MLEILLVLGLIAFSAALHATNMFGYPYYENDEGTYLSRGWAFITSGQLDVYTYRYDHAPAGWMAIGAWLGLTGGDAVFGSFLQSGRVLMLLVHVAATALVYVIAKRMGNGSIAAGAIAVVIFAASPLGLYFQRRVLLDNLMALWLLVAIALLLRRHLTLTAVITSGLFFGIAVLTKLNAAFFGIGFLVLLWARSEPHQRKHALAMWLAFAGGLVLMFLVYALLNEELLPAPLGADGEPLRVSFIDTMLVQAGRGDFNWPWEQDSSFLQSLESWLVKDPMTPLLGLIGVVALAALALVLRRRSLFPLAMLLMMAGYAGFLMRGKIVIDLYVAPLVPLFAIAVGIAVGWMLTLVPWRALRAGAAVVLVTALLTGFSIAVPPKAAAVDETSNQLLAVEWVAENIDPSAIVVTDNFAYPALAQERGFENAQYFFTSEYDPELREVYADDWRNIDYLIVTHELIQQMSQGTIPVLREAFEHSVPVASFTRGTSSFIDLDSYISTNGDWARVYEVKDRNDVVLQDSWASFLDGFVYDYGRVADGAGITTSMDQALAMDAALEQGDEQWFRGIWQWTNDHLRYRSTDGLISWRWQTGADGEGELLANDTVCGADQRMIASLIRAGDAWPAAGDLVLEGRAMAADFWKRCVIEQDGLALVDSSADGSVDDNLINPSYFDPRLYRELAGALPQYDWMRLVDDGYVFLDRLAQERGTIPDWVVLTREGELESAEPLIGAGADDLGDDTLRIVPALLLDRAAGDTRADALLASIAPQIVAYDGVVDSFASGSTVAMLAQLGAIDADARSLYESEVVARYDADDGFWRAPASLTDHLTGWNWHRFQSLIPASAAIELE
ncbi:glycosyl hydrolase family 8 [Microcella daejeonensis]|uniref:Glycosyl hydrolase family 8 n=1 Tax=Microcella daejeonensis TaxID=2994971 RepID=A0A9E8MMB5_9MICO|nr:glycosyl hydrolase family 8 [Microcella daejeonensis]WAB82152.1 glycosyl hydrolase family 8 [Microcella daejeonensis]